MTGKSYSGRQGNLDVRYLLGVFALVLAVLVVLTLIIVTGNKDEQNEDRMNSPGEEINDSNTDSTEDSAETSNTSFSGREGSTITYFGVNESLVSHGDEILVEWVSGNVEDCVASGFWSGEVSSEGEKIITAEAGEEQGRLTCQTGTGEEVEATTNITVDGPDINYFLVVDYDRENYQSVTLGWDSSGATQCMAEGAWSGEKAIRGNETLTGFSGRPASFDKTYRLTCYAGSEAVSVSSELNLLEEARKVNITE